MNMPILANMFICTRAYSSCLEISTHGPWLKTESIHCSKWKYVRVGSAAGSAYKSSDDFFSANRDKFDVIIVDGVHSCAQVARDIENALLALRPGGVVLIPNCLPTNAHVASAKPHGGPWCGDVYRAVALYFSRSPYLCYTVNADYGYGVIDTACEADPDNRFNPVDPGLTYDAFDANRAGLLHVVNVSAIRDLVARSLRRTTYNERPLYVITPTGDRPDTFAMCVDYINRQTRRPDMWLIVDDGRSDAVESQLSRIRVPYRLISLPPAEGNTLIRNFSTALAEVPDSACVCMIEDDDWYPVDYLETAYNHLLKADAVCVSECRYYHVSTRQYKVKKVYPTHGMGWSGPALQAIRSWVLGSRSVVFDSIFWVRWCGTRAFHDSIPGHIVGFGVGRSGSTAQHRVADGAEGWTKDADGKMLSSWVGTDAWRYIGTDKKVYVISNVDYPKEARLRVNEDDLLVFLNTARSLDYYGDHDNRIVYHRSFGPPYGDERLCVKNRYVYGAGDLSVPNQFINKMRARYDWDYPIEKGKIKSATTGYVVANYMADLYPDREVVLVNFGYTVAKSTYRCPWHNWRFEDYDLVKFRHIFTADVRDDDPNGEKPYSRKKRPRDEYRVAVAFTEAGSDRMTSHDYASVFTPQVLRLEGRKSKIAEIGGLHGSGVAGFMTLLPSASVYGVGVKKSDAVDGSVSVFGDGYSAKAWKDLPSDFDLIVDDGTHRLADMLRGLPVFLSHLKPGGVLMIEDVSSEEDAAELLRNLPGAVCHRTPPTSPHDDDRIVVYEKPADK